jgi:hypothetical protein
LQLLKEYVEHNIVNYVLEEGVEGKPKNLYIQGIFAEAELLNRNKRIYPLDVMTGAINEYVTEFVDKKRALGELSHPDGRPQVKPELASHLITHLKLEGNTVRGKALVLNTPQGQIVRGLLEGGCQLGVSTRALGSIKESNGTTYVQNDLKIFSVDIVSDPSSINAFVDAINESQEWVVTDDGRVLEKTKRIIDTTPHMNESQKLKLFGDFMLEIVSR